MTALPLFGARLTTRGDQDEGEKRGCGTLTMPGLGSMVQNGECSAGALWERLTALKSVDFPAFGRPMMPAFSMGQLYP